MEWFLDTVQPTDTDPDLLGIVETIAPVGKIRLSDGKVMSLSIPLGDGYSVGQRVVFRAVN